MKNKSAHPIGNKPFTRNHQQQAISPKIKRFVSPHTFLPFGGGGGEWGVDETLKLNVGQCDHANLQCRVVCLDIDRLANTEQREGGAVLG